MRSGIFESLSGLHQFDLLKTFLERPGRVLRMDPKPGIEYDLPARVTVVVSVVPISATPDSMSTTAPARDTMAQRRPQ